ncbi:hypothetical protein PTSG_10672 [Salpingoeca rosetta]|uniref:G-protein coupled receptors family 2 profile 2 domain-containing protein n=1 Tax=Salpingoeca rosetta (strain ATCC 50818 / BSB-021) TaxID=946362 RepID=F2UQ20_SALR5|nr:uncharacterized protein PTSG_10672 [Salpingoeca rosetta]EGD79688.1 hypothetical protein PTSG_10672 [Salpingoeca rosetta]|eukprot:XP_004988638.1 hypothetical protein PTSG_10672 [Salpingoeca rosetta]
MFHLRYHAVVWGLALVPAIVPLCTRGYAPAGAWCWIEQSQTALRFALWYVPMLLLLAVIGVSYVLMYRRLRSRQFSLRGEAIQEEDDSYRDNIATLKWYPVVYVVVSVFSVINRIQNAVHPSHPVYALYLLHSLSSPLQGLFNAAVYATSVASLRSTSFQSIKQALSHRLASPEMQEYTVHQPDEEGLMANTSSDSEADLLP